jgi:hypothetical protein
MYQEEAWRHTAFIVEAEVHEEDMSIDHLHPFF